MTTNQIIIRSRNQKWMMEEILTIKHENVQIISKNINKQMKNQAR